MDAIGTALFRDSELTLQLRSHYLKRDKSSAADSLAWAGGGWLDYRSGWLGDTLRIGLTAYSSQKLHGPADMDGASVLAQGQRSYTVLGESYGAVKLAEQTLTAGRFVVNQFEVNPQDTRMSPRSFQGAALTGSLGGASYYLARLDKMKSRHWDYFDTVAAVAGASANRNEPMWLLSLRGAPSEALSLGFASYRIRHLLTSSYADAAWRMPLGSDNRLSLGAQYFRQSSNGDRLLTGAAFDTWTGGLRAELLHGPLTLSALAMKTADSAAYRMPFGSWPGYASRIINNFNRAGERVRGLDAAVDFAKLGITGLSLNLSTTVGDRAINAANGAALSTNREHDINVDYRFTASHCPAWARPLWLRARAARFEQRLAGVRDLTDEYHLILNYTLAFR